MRRLVTGALFLSFALAMPAEGQDKAAAARSEGRVVIYSVLSNRAAAPLVEDFRALHPGIEVQYDGEMGSTELVDRFLSETSQGKPSADVLWSSAMDLQVKLVEDGHAMVYASPEAASLPAWAVYRDRAWGTTFEPVVFIYNKDRVAVEDVPRDHAAFARLLQAKPGTYAGKVAAFDIEKSGVGFMFAARDRRHFAGLDELTRAFGRVDYQPSAGTGTMLEKVASGEYLLGYNIMGAYALVRAKRQPTLGVVLPRDYTLVLSRVAFINRNAPHPNAARLWIDYLLSKRGQAVIGNRLELFAIRDDVDAEYSASRLSREIGAAIRPIPLATEIVADLAPARRRELIDAWNAGVAGGRTASVTVSFPDARRDTDAGEGLDAQRNRAEIARHLEELGKRHLQPGQNLRIEILDVNLGGRVKPQPGTDARVARAGDWPQVRLRYELETPGAPVRKGEELVSDREYLRGPQNDWSALGREKRMLEEWFRARFVRPP